MGGARRPLAEDGAERIDGGFWDAELPRVLAVERAAFLFGGEDPFSDGPVRFSRSCSGQDPRVGEIGRDRVALKCTCANARRNASSAASPAPTPWMTRDLVSCRSRW